MMGVPFSVCSYGYGDNMSVINNIQRPESTLRKKSKYICYHAVCEAVAMGETNNAHISTHDNGSNLLTKYCMGPIGRKFSEIFYDVYD